MRTKPNDWRQLDATEGEVWSLRFGRADKRLETAPSQRRRLDRAEAPHREKVLLTADSGKSNRP